MKQAQSRFWDYHYVGFGNAPVAFGDHEVLLDVRGWEAVCSPVSCGTEALCWFVESEPECRNGRKLQTSGSSRQDVKRQKEAAIRDAQEAFRKGKWGRFAAFNPGGKYGRLRAYLYLRADGTGYFRGVYCYNWLDEKPIEFTWNPVELGLRDTQDILTAPIAGREDQWEAFCRRVLDEQIAPHFADPLVTREELIDKPLRYLCGSEVELRQVTTWICHCHDDQDALFGEGTAEVSYAPRIEEELCGLWAITGYSLPIVSDRDNYSTYGFPPCPSNLMLLLDLAFLHNTFEGHFWYPRHGWENAGDCRRRGDWSLNREWRNITIVRPSAHERAESLLCLFDWLDGKVSPAQQRALLGLDT